MESNNELMEPPTKKHKVEDSVIDVNFTKVDFTQDVDKSFGDEKKNILMNEDKYNFVTSEEMEKLKEFKVLDEVKSEDEDSNEDDSEASDGKSDGIPEEEIDEMLEENLPEDFKGTPKPKEKPYRTRQKIVLQEKGVNQFEVLPLDWIMVRHCSGMPVYLHRTTRVCTLSKPYFLGKENVRRHEIPIGAIPCLAYRKALEEEEKQKEIDKIIEEQIKSGTWKNNVDKESIGNHLNINNFNLKKPNFISTDTFKKPQPKLDINKCPYVKSTEINENESLNIKSNETSDVKNNDVDINTCKTDDNKDTTEIALEKSVCQDLSSNTIEEKVIATSNANENMPKPVVLPGGIVMPPPRVETVDSSWKTQHLNGEQVNDYCKALFKFKTINVMHFKEWTDRRRYTKVRKALQYPSLPHGSKLITIPAQQNAGQDNGNTSNKRDWVMNMNGRSYLSVFHEYVRRALQDQPVYQFSNLENASTPYQATVYIGGMQYGIGYGSSKRQAKSAAARESIHILIPEMKDELDPTRRNTDEPDFSFFDNVGIEDPRITEFCAVTCEPSPHAILRTCLLRNFGTGDRHIQTEMKKLEYQKIELTMKVGKHSASVVCKNKKQAKQRASQAILQALHPHVHSWGSLLRLYGSRSVKSCKEKKLEEQQITLLQDKAKHNEPNYAVLEKLREEMRKLQARDEAVVPIGTMLLTDHLPTHSASNLNNVDL